MVDSGGTLCKAQKQLLTQVLRRGRAYITHGIPLVMHVKIEKSVLDELVTDTIKYVWSQNYKK